MSKDELKLLLAMLPAMSAHFKSNPDSLLSKIFGAFTVKIDSTSDVHLMLMENTMQLQNPDNGLKYIFDLKGSLVDRKVKGSIKPTTTLKDCNFLIAAEHSKNFISLSSRQKSKLLKIVNSDVEFLSG